MRVRLCDLWNCQGCRSGLTSGTTEALCFSFPLLWKCTRPCYHTLLHYLLFVYQFIAASVCLLYDAVYCVKVTCSKGKESPASSLTVAWQAHMKHLEDRKMDEGLIQTSLWVKSEYVVNSFHQEKPSNIMYQEDDNFSYRPWNGLHVSRFWLTSLPETENPHYPSFRGWSRILAQPALWK